MEARPVLAFVLVLAAGCGGGNGTPKPVQGPAKEAAAVVERLQQATARRDFRVICDELLSEGERRQAGGDQCATLLAERAHDVRHPRIRITQIELGHDSARVHVTTTAAGQAPVTDVIQLVREAGRFRIASLGS